MSDISSTSSSVNQVNIAGVTFVLGSRYEAKGLAGQGGFGIVLKGTDLHTGKQVAIKKIAPLSIALAVSTAYLQLRLFA